MGSEYIRKTVEQMENDAFQRAAKETIFAEKINDDEYIVTNIDHMSIYKVICEEGYVTDCDCPHHRYRGVICKHMVTVSAMTGYSLNK